MFLPIRQVSRLDYQLLDGSIKSKCKGFYVTIKHPIKLQTMNMSNVQTGKKLKSFDNPGVSFTKLCDASYNQLTRRRKPQTDLTYELLHCFVLHVCCLALPWVVVHRELVRW